MREENLSQLSVLYVEDDKAIQEEIVEVLELSCKELLVANDGQEGLQLFTKHRPDIVLSDIRMPKMSGLEMSEAITAIDPQTPIIINSAFNDSSYLLDAIRLGISHYLIKPFRFEELLTALEKAAVTVVQAKELKRHQKLLTAYKEAVDQAAIVLKMDSDGTISYVNEAFCKISGYSRDESVGGSYALIRHPDTSDFILGDLWHTILSKKAWQGVLKHQTKDGSYYVANTTIIPVLNSANEIEEFLSIGKDVTHDAMVKQKLKDELINSAYHLDMKQRFILEYENALQQSTLFCRATQDGLITKASDAFISLFHLDADEVNGSSYFSLVDPSERKVLDEEVRASIRNMKPWQGLIRHRNKQGEELFLNTSFIPIQNMQGRVEEVFCFYVDMTEQILLNKEIVSTQREVISMMGAIGETRSKETGDHVKRVAEYSKILALKYGLSEKEAEDIKMASPMHDIGKVGIPDNILNKQGRLDDPEFEIMKTHAMLGYEMLKGSKQSLLETASIISLTHHEKWDGSGYPYALKGEDIHIYGRITAIADVFDALGHDRVYKKAWPMEKILQLFKEERGKHFDPRLIDIFFENLDDFLDVKERFDGR